MTQLLESNEKIIKLTRQLREAERKERSLSPYSLAPQGVFEETHGNLVF